MYCPSYSHKDININHHKSTAYNGWHWPKGSHVAAFHVMSGGSPCIEFCGWLPMEKCPLILIDEDFPISHGRKKQITRSWSRTLTCFICFICFTHSYKVTNKCNLLLQYVRRLVSGCIMFFLYSNPHTNAEEVFPGWVMFDEVFAIYSTFQILRHLSGAWTSRRSAAQWPAVDAPGPLGTKPSSCSPWGHCSRVKTKNSRIGKWWSTPLVISDWWYIVNLRLKRWITRGFSFGDQRTIFLLSLVPG
jgi:hypothetical protein